MTGEESLISTRAQALRETFDRGFAHLAAAGGDTFEGVLTIRVCGEPYAVALGEVHGLFVDRKIVPLPARCSESMGITCLRTGIVAVYSLRAFLGYPPAEVPARWLISAGERQPFALAFERFEAYARVPHSEFLSAPATSRDGHIQGTATIGGERRSIISLRSIAQSISTRS
jgi:chemotaxis signal transduction protein